MKDPYEALNQLGLNESEIKVYFALLELESSTVGPIIEKSKVADSKVYLVLDKLKEKGLVSQVIKGNYKHFQATEPINLIRILEEKELEITEQKKKIREEIIPLIEHRRKNTEEKQEATLFEGLKGMRSAYQYVLDTMKKGETYRVFHLLDEPLKQKEVSGFYRDYHLRRAEKGVFVRFIAHEKEKKIVFKSFNQPKSEFRYTKDFFPVGILIFKGHVLTTIWGEGTPTAILVKSERNYKYYKQFFDHTWNKSRIGHVNK